MQGERAAGATPPIGGYYQVGGRRLFLHRSGSGAPSVVFLAGAGAVGLDYLNVHDLAAELTTSVIYDRAGNGWSDGVALPRTSQQVTAEVAEFAHVADVPGPTVLIGHSLGGLYARHFAARFPDRVAGLVLLDPAHEDYDTYMPEQLNAMREAYRTFQVMNAVLGAALSNPLTSRLLTLVPALRRMQDKYRKLFEQETAEGFPEPIRRLLVERHVSPQWLRVGMLEAKNVEQPHEEVQGAGSLPDLPLGRPCPLGTDGIPKRTSLADTAARGTGGGGVPPGSGGEVGVGGVGQPLPGFGVGRKEFPQPVGFCLCLCSAQQLERTGCVAPAVLPRCPEAEVLLGNGLDIVRDEGLHLIEEWTGLLGHREVVHFTAEVVCVQWIGRHVSH